MTHWVKPYPEHAGKTQLQPGQFECWDTPPPADSGWVEAIEVRPDKTKPHWEQYYGEHFVDMTKSPAEIVWPLEDFSPEEVAEHAASYLAQANSVIQDKLDVIDLKKVRAATDAIINGDHSRLIALEAEAAALRASIKKDVSEL